MLKVDMLKNIWDMIVLITISYNMSILYLNNVYFSIVKLLKKGENYS